MAGDKNRKEALDRAGRSVLRAARATDAETRQAADAPFLYARIRARIDAEKQRTQRSQVQPLLWLVGRRAIPALALVAVLALGSFWVFGSRAAAPPSEDAPTSLTAPPANPILTGNQPGFIPSACSIAAKDECAVSTNDVIAILTNSGEGQRKP